MWKGLLGSDSGPGGDAAAQAHPGWPMKKLIFITFAYTPGYRLYFPIAGK
jgi:hypothetical protein